MNKVFCFLATVVIGLLLATALVAGVAAVCAALFR